MKPGHVRTYACGPTVYDYPHIGNLRSFVFSDILRRWLAHSGFKVKQIMNITDVDDKTIKGSQSAGLPLSEFTRKYENIFFSCLQNLNIKPAAKYTRATEHISEMLSLIEKLMKKGLAYKAADGIYFDISKFRGYGKLSGVLAEKSMSRIASDEYDKEHVQDFALWKFWKPADGKVFWQSPWGKGRPGWHIECSAMSMKYLGKSLDIHTGGTDLKFPHHENEIAQSTGATGKKFVNYWLHCEHLMVEGRKMAKSLGNIITLNDVNQKGISPLSLRYLLLTSHYRSQMNFTFESLQHSSETVEKLNDFYSKVHWLSQIRIRDKVVFGVKEYENLFKHHLDNDLDTVNALAAVHNAISDFNKALDKGTAGSRAAKVMLDFLQKVNSVLAVITEKEKRITSGEKKLISKREKLRKLKKFREADLIREQLHKKKIILEDTPYGPRWKKA
ncbi:MAG: cysteine--tRNA ligase [Candidatus Aenigmarchaeota archaeon]|nr:cysteine--tRNA ligase [Candidatus Aenigmarchaeota archaeon]